MEMNPIPSFKDFAALYHEIPKEWENFSLDDLLIKIDKEYWKTVGTRHWAEIVMRNLIKRNWISEDNNIRIGPYSHVPLGTKEVRPKFEILYYLSFIPRDEPTTCTALISPMGVTKRTVSLRLKKLFEVGFMEGTPGKTKYEKTIWKMTEAGKVAFDEMYKEVLDEE